MISEIPRYLITTADERTWKFDCPVLFLGEWCRLYERKHIWESMDAIVAKPYGLGLAHKDADYAQARAIEDRIFPKLYEVLNQHHGTQYGQRFWKVVLGHWLRRYVDVIFNRIRTLEQCLVEYQIDGTAAFTDEYYSLATVDSYSAIWAFSDDRWNNKIYSRILNQLDVRNFQVDRIPGDTSEGYSWQAMITEPHWGKQILKCGYEDAKKLIRLFARYNEAFILNTYLPTNEEIKLQFSLRQVPQLWTSPMQLITNKVNHDLRHRLSKHIIGTYSHTVEGILISMIFEILPLCYLENFEILMKKIRQLPWPEKPKFIFTGNNFDTDEVFKLWTAVKIETGTPYIVGQHGNNYGTYRYMFPSVEEATADKFLTWGWTDGLIQHTPSFIFRTSGRRVKKYNSKGGLLLIELPMPHRITVWDNIYEFVDYFEDQQRFIINLQKLPRKRLTIRLHSSYRNTKWGEELRWRTFDENLKIETGRLNIKKMVAQSRLVIHSYDSTGLLETLSLNIPTLAFWQNGFEHLRESAKPYYKLLMNVGIIHLSPESTARKVNEVWDDVAGWWEQVEVQKARQTFCDRYAKFSQNPIVDLKKVLLQNEIP